LDTSLGGFSYVAVKTTRYQWYELSPSLPDVIQRPDEIGDVLYGIPQFAVLLSHRLQLGVELL
jgi:hypothetical protein